jgi:geranylgeranyl diphosphate synthase type I
MAGPGRADAGATADSAVLPPALSAVRDRIDPVLARFLADRRSEVAAMDPAAAVLIDELLRLLAAGGKRIRPALAFWAARAAGGPDRPPLVRAAASLELLHTFALIHDDVMDATVERRGVAATHARFAAIAPPGAEPAAYGTSIAILAGDLAAVLAERMLRACGAAPERLEVALDRFDRMRVEMAAGQYLDVAGSGDRGRVAALKTASYTTEGPVLIGAALAGAAPAAEGALRVYARLVGEAFQLRDDVLDGEAAPGDAGRVDDLVARAAETAGTAPLDPEGARALADLAEALRLGGA